MDALNAIKRAGIQYCLVIRRHVFVDHPERNLSSDDIHNAAAQATDCKAQDNGRYKVSGGTDMSGENLDLICVVETNVIVITAF